MERIEKKRSNFYKYAKAFVLPIQNALQKFSNNIIIKSLVSGFVSAMPIVLVSSFFILIYAIPEAIDENVLNNSSFLGFKAFAVRAYQFTYGILGLVVTGNIARAMMEELNINLPFNKKVRTYNVLITGMITYFIMSAVIPGSFDPAKDAWFESINWQQMGAQGILPGIIIGLTTPFIFYWCYQYNITIRLPKAVPGVISQSFLAVIPFALAILIWATISYGFIAILGQPFVPWFFAQLSDIIPQLQYEGNNLTADDFLELPKEIQEVVANDALNSFSNSYGIIVLFRFLETFSWFMGVHPEAIQGVFESIMAVNQEMNVVFDSIEREESFAFVNSLMGPTGNMGGTGSTFVVPIICLLFCRSTQSKVAGRTSIIPVAFQVNEPILFGQPIVLNPYFLFPFITVPILNSIMAKVFVDNFGLMATQIDLPWSIPWFIRGPVAHLAQPSIFLLLLITFGISLAIYLPFVIWYDKSLVKLEIEKIGKEQFVSMNGLQYQLNKMLSYDNNAHKQYLFEKRNLSAANLNAKDFEIAKINLFNKYNQTTIKNLFKIFSKIKDSKLEKATEKYNSKVNIISQQMKINQNKMEKYNSKLDTKIDAIKASEELWEKTFPEKIEAVLAKKKKHPQAILLNSNFETKYKIEVRKIITNYAIQKNIILKKRSKKGTNLSIYDNKIKKLKNNLEKYIFNLKSSENKKLKMINQELKKYTNPFKLVNLSNELNQETKSVDVVSKIDENKKNEIKNLNVLVLCIGAGTSAMLANSINEGSMFQNEFKINANALAYDQYKEALNGVDLVITSPQLGAYLPTIKADAGALDIKVASTKGKQYIDLSNNPKEAALFAIENYKGIENNEQKN